MGLLSHLQNIFNMKADAALNAAEEPGQVFDYSYTKQLEQLQQLRRAIAEVVTNEKHIELLEAQVEEQSNHLQAQAAQALQAGREDLARTALQRKEALSAQIDAYKQQLAQLAAQQSHVEEVEQKVAQRVEQFRSQKEMVKAQYQAAQAQVNVNEAVTGISNEMTEMNLAMQRAQDKVLTMQARAGALDTLLEHGALGDQGLLGAPNSDIDQQLQQISAEHDVEAQLAALKQQMSGPSAGQPQIGGPEAQTQHQYISISHKAGLAGGDLPIELCRHPGCAAPVGWSILARRLGHPVPLIVTGPIGEKRSLQAAALIDAPIAVGHRDGQYCFWQSMNTG